MKKHSNISYPNVKGIWRVEDNPVSLPGAAGNITKIVIFRLIVPPLSPVILGGGLLTEYIITVVPHVQI